MSVTNAGSGTAIHEVADGIFRISTPVQIPGGGFSFNQFLIVDEEPVLYHTGPRKLFPLVKEAVETVIPAATLRHIAFSHFEADECGSLNEWLAAAPRSAPLCGWIAAMVSVDDVADRPARALQDGESISLGRHSLEWIDAPHLPHAWECGHFMEASTGTLFCGDLFTQPGAEHPPTTEADILGPSEAFRQAFDYYSHTKHLPALIEKLAAREPGTLACMHGSTWKGDGASLLRELGRQLDGDGS
ncbi:MAG: MBL fold metallo-hydrolase [Planctomycetota bacterium]